MKRDQPGRVLVDLGVFVLKISGRCSSAMTPLRRACTRHGVAAAGA